MLNPSKLSEIVVGIIDNNDGTATVLYWADGKYRQEPKLLPEARELLRLSRENEKKQNEFLKHNGHLFGQDELYRRQLVERENFRDSRELFLRKKK